VSAILRTGETLSAETATYAQQWGDVALVTLVGIPDLWTISALRVDCDSMVSKQTGEKP
jgi:hypothetical protein